MKNPRKYFVFNKKEDFERGFCENIEIAPSGIRIKDLTSGSGHYITRLLDSRERMMNWHRFRMTKEAVEESALELFFYSSDDEFMKYKDQDVAIEDFLKDTSISIGEKMQATERFLRKQCYAVEDMLLQEITGRFLWLLIRFRGRGAVSPQIDFMQIIFPKETWMEYLPEIYQESKGSSPFLERYLGIFQTIYEDMTEQITKVPNYMEVPVAERKFLLWIADWLAIDDEYLWTTKQLRYLLQNAVSLYQRRGTVGYLKEIVKLYTGKEAYVVEYHQLEEYRNNDAKSMVLYRLYGENPYLITVILDTESITSNEQYRILCHMIENSVPANVMCNVVVLKPYIFLEQYSYLGINSILGKYQPLRLDGLATLPFITLEDQSERMMPE